MQIHWIIMIWPLVVVISVTLQNKLARELLRRGYKWSNQPVTGNLWKRNEGQAWTKYILSLSWTKIDDFRLKLTCAGLMVFFWLTNLILLVLLIRSITLR